MASPEGVDVPFLAQLGVFLGAIGTAIAAYVNAKRGSKAEKEAVPEASHVVMETASLTDTRPFKDLLNLMVANGERNARANEAILSVMQEWVAEERKARAAQEHEDEFQSLKDYLLKTIDEKMKQGASAPR